MSAPGCHERQCYCHDESGSGAPLGSACGCTRSTIYQDACECTEPDCPLGHGTSGCVELHTTTCVLRFVHRDATTHFTYYLCGTCALYHSTLT